MAKKSIPHKLDTIRPPSVHITYDLEKGDAIEKKDLPFVMAVLGDYAGHRELGDSLETRSFTPISRDNFDAVLGDIRPELRIRVKDTMVDPKSDLEGGENLLNVTCKFFSMKDFSPDRVAQMVPDLARLLETRSRLKDLIGTLMSDRAMRARLSAILDNAEEMEKIHDWREREAAREGEPASKGQAKVPGGDGVPTKE